MTSRPIVVGTDGSEESLRAVGWAAREAARRTAPLRVVSVPPGRPSEASHDGAPEMVDDLLRSMYAEALRSAAERAGDIAPGVAVETKLLSGAPGRALAGDSSRASMLVVGASGIGGYGEVGLGRVSGYLARHANCPLVVVRDDQDRPMSHEIVVGVRDADEAAAALRFAVEEAAVRGTRLLAVHCWYWFPPALLLSPEKQYATQLAAARLDVLDAQALSEDAAVRLAEVLSTWQDKYPGVQVSQQVVHGHPGHVLAGLTSHADLVVLARHDGRGGIRPGSGSIQSAVLNHAEGPVAVIPCS